MNKEIFARIAEIMSSLCDNGPLDTITPDLSFRTGLGLESIDSIDLVMSVETSYNLSIDMTNATSLVTIGDFVNYIEPIIDGKLKN